MFKEKRERLRGEVKGKKGERGRRGGREEGRKGRRGGRGRGKEGKCNENILSIYLSICLI